MRLLLVLCVLTVLVTLTACRSTEKDYRKVDVFFDRLLEDLTPDLNEYRRFDPETYLKEREENADGRFNIDGYYERSYDDNFLYSEDLDTDTREGSTNFNFDVNRGLRKFPELTETKLVSDERRELREFFENLSKLELERDTETQKRRHNDYDNYDHDHDHHKEHHDHDHHKEHHDHDHHKEHHDHDHHKEYHEHNYHDHDHHHPDHDHHHPDIECFDFVRVFSRYLVKFPNFSNYVRNTAIFDLGFSDIAEQAITSLRLVRRPRLIAKEMVHRLTVRILNDLDGCAATKVHQGLVYVLSKAMEMYTTKYRDQICQFSDNLDKVSEYIGPQRVFDEFKQNIFFELIDMISNSGYEDLFEDLTEIENALEFKLATALNESTQLQVDDLEPVLSLHLKSTIGCQDELSVQELIKTINTELLGQKNGIPLDRILAELEEPMQPYFDNSTIYYVAGLIQNVGQPLINEVLQVFSAFVNKDVDYLINNKIIDPEMRQGLEQITDIIGDVDFDAGVNFSYDSTVKKRSDRSSLLEQLIDILKRNKPSLIEQRNITDSGYDGTTESPYSSSGSPYYTSGSYDDFNSTPIPPTIPSCRALIGGHSEFPHVDPCFNFRTAVGEILGGFPNTNEERPEINIEIEPNELQGVIEKSMTAFRIFNDNDLTANELVFSVSEMILEKRKGCPATMLNRALFYLIARSLDNYESEKLASIQELADQIGNSDLTPIIDESNRFAVGFILSSLRDSLFDKTFKQMKELLLNVSTVLSEPNVSTKKLEMAMQIYDRTRWTFECNNHVTVRHQLEKVKGTIRHVIGNVIHIPHQINGRELPPHTRETIQQIITSSLSGFVTRIDDIFMAVLKKDRNYLVNGNILTHNQVDALNEIMFEIGGSLLPSFVFPVTENEIFALKELQDVLINNASGEEIKQRTRQLVLNRCQELQNVHVEMPDEVVREFFENCNTLHASMSANVNISVR